MTTTTPTSMQRLKAALIKDPHARWYLGHAFAMRQASRWASPALVHPDAVDSFRIVMRSSARMAIHSAKLAAGLKGGAL